MPLPPAPEAYRRLRWGLALAVRAFFRRVEVVGLENLPADRGGILVAWHPNGLVDPALILSAFPGQVAFGARDTLFRLPLIGRFARAIGTVPIYRRQDTDEAGIEEARAKNDVSLGALADRIAAGSFSALFPEGYSHDAPHLQEIKTGAARLYYRARMRTPGERPPPVIIPVGLHYAQKRLFRSNALVVFHPPVALPAELDVTPAPDADPERLRELARALTHEIERQLKAVVFDAESWELHGLLHRARKLIRAERAHRVAADPGAATMDEKILGLARVWLAYRERMRTDPAKVEAIERRVRRYDAYLRALGIEDHELDRPPPVVGRWFWVGLALQIVSVVVLLPPLLLIGAIVNLPPVALVTAWARLVGKEQKDMASLKLIGGVVAFPVAWGVWAGLAAWGIVQARAWAPWVPDQPLVAAAAMVALGVAGAAVMLLYWELALGTLRALRVRFTRGLRTRALERLRRERSRLCDELEAMARGLDLPGLVLPSGRLARK